MVSEVISFIILTAATVTASALVAGYLAAAASQTTARINEQTAKQVLVTSESLTMVMAYACNGGNELCVDAMNNSGRPVGISYAYDQNGNAVAYRILDSSGNVVPELPIGAGTIAISPATVTGVTLMSENLVVYRVLA